MAGDGGGRNHYFTITILTIQGGGDGGEGGMRDTLRMVDSDVE